MPKTKISEFSSTPANNTDIDSINISEGCAPSGINDAIRELMAQLKDWQSGTSNDPMVIGSSGSLTLNQGTANGVAYLNGSKVVTSGSALTFDGTNLALTTTGAIYKVPTAGGSLFDAGGNNGIYILGSSNYVATYVAGSEQMRLTSTGLGIGTSSPANKLDVNNTGGTTTGGIRVYATDQAYARLNVQNANGQAYHLVAGTPGASNSGFAIYDATAGATRVQLDSSGNLGLGVTPSAWWVGFKAIELSSNGAALLGQTNAPVTHLTANATNNGTNWLYKTTYYASRYEQDATSGKHAWYTAPSGTAGNAITFTQAMSLTASGELLIATTTTTGNGAAFLPAGSGSGMLLRIARASEGTAHQFAVNSNVVGSIYTTASATTYNTSSDYRLKNITGALTGYKERLMSLQPKQGTWIADGSEFRGFLAHEFANPYRASVTGEKDAVDEAGNPVMQGMQASSSEVMADLVAMVNELITENASLKARLDAANL